MTAENLQLTGKIMWANNLFAPDKAFDEDGIYHVDFYPDDESKAKLLDAGTRLKLKQSKDTGEEYWVLRRNEKHVIPQFGGKPMVVHPDGETEWTTDDPLIGNGTKATVIVQVYDSKMGKGTRLEAVRIDDLVEFVRPEDGEEAEMPQKRFAFE